MSFDFRVSVPQAVPIILNGFRLFRKVASLAMIACEALAPPNGIVKCNAIRVLQPVSKIIHGLCLLLDQPLFFIEMIVHIFITCFWRLVPVFYPSFVVRYQPFLS